MVSDCARYPCIRIFLYQKYDCIKTRNCLRCSPRAIPGFVVCAPLSWSTEHFQPAGMGCFRSFFMTALVREGYPAQACRFSCFFCAAYGLLLTQTRTRCSNSASRAIAMLEKTAKISPNVCAGISLSNECGHVENSYVFINDVGRYAASAKFKVCKNKKNPDTTPSPYPTK